MSEQEALQILTKSQSELDEILAQLEAEAQNHVPRDPSKPRK